MPVVCLYFGHSAVITAVVQEVISPAFLPPYRKLITAQWSPLNPPCSLLIWITALLEKLGIQCDSFVLSLLNCLLLSFLNCCFSLSCFEWLLPVLKQFHHLCIFCQFKRLSGSHQQHFLSFFQLLSSFKGVTGGNGHRAEGTFWFLHAAASNGLCLVHNVGQHIMYTTHFLLISLRTLVSVYFQYTIKWAWIHFSKEKVLST